MPQVTGQPAAGARAGDDIAELLRIGAGGRVVERVRFALMPENRAHKPLRGEGCGVF